MHLGPRASQNHDSRHNQDRRGKGHRQPESPTDSLNEGGVIYVNLQVGSRGEEKTLPGCLELIGKLLRIGPDNGCILCDKVPTENLLQRNRKSPDSRDLSICLEIFVSSAMSSKLNPVLSRNLCSSSPKAFGWLGAPSIAVITGEVYHPSLS